VCVCERERERETNANAWSYVYVPMYKKKAVKCFFNRFARQLCMCHVLAFLYLSHTQYMTEVLCIREREKERAMSG
jgi:hypothetical protein